MNYETDEIEHRQPIFPLSTKWEVVQILKELKIIPESYQDPKKGYKRKNRVRRKSLIKESL